MGSSSSARARKVSRWCWTAGWKAVEEVGGGEGRLQGLWDVGLEDGEGMRRFIFRPLWGRLGIVRLQVEIEANLHLVEGLVPGGPALHPETLIEERSVEALDQAVGLGPAHPGGAMFDALELEEEFVGVPRAWPRMASSTC